MAYPTLTPSSRSFDAGDYSYKSFKAQNGTEVRILYGDKRTGMKLSLNYENISDTSADDFIAHYDEVKGGYLSFALPAVVRNGWAGSAAAIDAVDGNAWRYESAPAINSVRPGISSVTVNLIGVL